MPRPSPVIGTQPQLLVFAAIAVLGLISFSAAARAATGDARQQGTRTFVVASSDNFPPVNMLDKDGNLSGFGRDLSTAVIRAIGGQTTYIHAPVWSEVLDYLNSGKADFIHDTAYAKDRDVFLDFSDPVLEMKEVIIVRPEQYTINSFESLKGKRVACVNKHITHLYLLQFPKIQCQIVKTPAEGLYSLIAGDVDAFVYPEQIVTYLSQELRLGDKLKMTGEPLRTLTWSMVVKEGDKELLGLLNEGIRKVRKSGEYERIYARWFGTRILAGYSRKEIWFFGLMAVVASLAFGVAIGLLVLNTRLRNSRDELFNTIAERQRTEEALNKSRRLLLETERMGKVGGWEFNIDTGKQTWTEEVYNIHEVDLSYDPTVGKGIDFYAPDSRPIIEQAVQRAIAQGQPFDVELGIVTAKGNLRSVHAIGKADLENRRVYGFFQDITERKQAEDKLRLSEHNLAEAERIGNTGSWDYDVASDTASWSGNMFRIFDVDPALPRELVFKHFVGNLVHPDDRLSVLSVFQDALSGKRSYDIEYRIVKRDGSVRRIHALAETLRDRQGKPVRMIGMVEDITERKQAEEALQKLNLELEQRVVERTIKLERRSAELDESRQALMNLVEDLNRKTEEVAQANARLQELDRLKSMFIASMSHELRTPLNSIIGFTGIILQGLTGEITGEQRKQLSMVQNSARHLLALINDIIDISKIEAGSVELAPKEFDLAALVREALGSLEATAAGKGLKLAGDGPERLSITSDERRVKQIVLNLIGNAVKFTEQGEIAVRLSEVGGRAAVAVRDSGPGIRAADRELLFKAFSRLPAGNKTIKEGTGLGLYLSKRIADLLGGEIMCESEYGKGSTFTFVVPVEPLTPTLSPSGGEG